MSNDPSEPHDLELLNSDALALWTCPGCYSDLHGVDEGTHTCPECDRKVTCDTVMRPVRRSRLLNGEN